MRPLLLALACLLLLSGCGLGEGEAQTGAVELRVTRDFGHERVGAVREENPPEGQTVMRLLRSSFDAETRFGGRFVQSIEGLEGGGVSGRRDWFFFVNGIEASVGAAEFELSPGDVVQWDLRDWGAAMRVPAIVGAFPEPFRSGREGKRLPVRVECAEAGSEPCREARRRLRELGAKPAGASLGASGGGDVLRVVVAPWREARLVRAVAALSNGPAESGVFARIDEDGRALELLDERGQVARRAPPGSGLVAALAPRAGELVWLLTGLDERGVGAAVEALRERPLRDAFAVAATPGGPVELPLRAPS